jgi:hypothetical protein
MPDDINELDVTDAGLKAIMGNRFHDETQKEPQKDISKKETTTSTCLKSLSKRSHEVYKDGSWEPSKERTWMDNLKDCAKWAAGFGGLSFLLFYWEQAGLMAESVAVPCMCFCTALAGWGVGKNARCK